MKLSEAMRKGAEFAPQCQMSFAVSNLHGVIIYTCAFGAAAHGMLGREASEIEVREKAHHLAMAFNAPSTDTRPHFTEIFSMNDSEGLTREEIAEWLEERGL